MNIDSQLADEHTREYPLGKRIAEGKTKIIHKVKTKPGLAIIIAKDDITAGDGAKHDILPGKGVWATETACNVFELLASHGQPVAYIGRDGVNSFIAQLCTMLTYEVVVRREAHGSYLKRHPECSKGDRFTSEPKLEFYLKTQGKRWKQHELPCDDPFMKYEPLSNDILLYRPDVPWNESEPFLVLDAGEVWATPNEGSLYEKMAIYAYLAFVLLEIAWASEDGTLADFKVEFGLAQDGTLLIADVIDNDSWRVVKDGKYLDKQTYRDGGGLEEVAKLYQMVAEITGTFN